MSTAFAAAAGYMLIGFAGVDCVVDAFFARATLLLQDIS